MELPQFDTKDPLGELFYTWGLSLWLKDGESVIGYSLIDFPADLVQLSDNSDANSITVKIGGGVAGVNYPIKVRFETDAAQVSAKTIILPVDNT